MRANFAKFLLFANAAERQNLTIETLTVTENGTYTAAEGTAYGKAEVNVPNHWGITTSLTNLTATGDTVIYSGNTATVTLAADEGYTLPDTVTVSGATHTYDATTGEVELSVPTGEVTVTAAGTAEVDDAP